MPLSRAAAFLLAVVAAATLGPFPSGPAPAATSRRPNVLIIVTDDQRFDSLDVMPATDRWLADAGTTFANAFVTTPLCCPSRGSIFTGRYAHNHAVTTNQNAQSMDPRATLQSYLGRAGYRTGIVGKYFNGIRVRRDPPQFDRWAIMKKGYRRATFNVDGRLERFRGYSTDFIARTTGGILADFERRDGSPWLMFVTPHAPHLPATPAVRHEGSSIPPWDPPPSVGEDRSDKPGFVADRGEPEMGFEQLRALQLRSLMAVDDLVDRLMHRLAALGERDRTLVIFTSDNGYYWGEHGLDDKRLPYLEAARVPLLLRWPGHVPAGVMDHRLVANVDIVPTVLQAAGYAGRLRAPLDGRSLMGPDSRDRMLLEYWVDTARSDVPSWAAITTEELQYVEYYASDGQTIVFQEYYDLGSDPWQLENLLGDEDESNDPTPAELTELSTRLAADRRCVGTAEPTACP
ncbi:MAG: sulfatase [Actinomycetota bacterium]|nr:sulfatase [Actinomycetota bacterium]